MYFSMRTIILLLFILTSAQLFSQNWENLIGSDLTSLKQLNGQAPFTLEEGVLVGTAVMGQPNSFMATKKTYGDFILEFDVLIENGMNSGVQFRSLSIPEYNDGRVHGYQCELETSPRKWAAGIYDEARRGWLYPLTRNEKSQSAFVRGSWNRVRIEAVNDIQCARLVDDLTAEGFIAFQVHSIGSEKEAGKKVKWKNIRILTDKPQDYRLKADPTVAEISYLKNELTTSEKNQGWRLLWDGKSTQGWRGAKLEDFPTHGWKMEDGILTVLASGGGESTNGGDIVTIKEYSNFELELDFMISKGANSGIKYFVDPELNKGEGSAIGLEFQILDDKAHPDSKMGKNGNRTIGSLYDLMRAENLSEANRSGKRFNGVDRWNRARIIVKGGHVEHWLNGKMCIEYDWNSFASSRSAKELN